MKGRARVVRRLAALVVVLTTSCASPTAPQPALPSPAAISVSSFSVAVDSTNASVYHTSLTLKETAGASGATVTALTYTVDRPGGPLTVPYTPPTAQRIPPGGSLSLGPIDVTDSSASASQITVSVAFTDDGQRGGTVSATSALARPIPASPASFTLSGIVTDNTSGGILPNVIVQIVDGPNAGWSTFTDGAGRYTLTGISPGSFTLSATSISYETTTRPVTMASDTRVDLVLVRSTPRIPRLTGVWQGTAMDSQGAMFVTWSLSENNGTITGTVNTRAVHPDDGSCSACHRSKSGTVSGSIAGGTVNLSMFFAAGGSGDPTPICSASFSGSASSFTDDSLIASYSGADTCEGSFLGGTLPMTRLP